MLIAGTDSGGWELYRSDGTTIGTSIVEDIRATGSGLPQITHQIINDVLYVYSIDDSHGIELRSYSVNETAGVTDSDGDGIPNTEEKASPLGYDINEDSVKDQYQTTVTSELSDVTGEYISAVVENCTAGFQSFVTEAEEDVSNDVGYDYPLGLQNFTADCGTPGSTADFTIYFDKEYDTSNWMYRKYTPAKGFFDFNDQVTYGTETVNGKTVTTVSFSVTDGSEFDADGLANGIIVDPVGPAVLGELAETGISSVQTVIFGLFAISVVAALGKATQPQIYRLRGK